MWAYISLKCQVEAGAQSREVNTMMKHWGEEPCGGEKRSKGIFKAVIFNPDLKMENTGKILSFQRRIFQCLTMFLGFLNRISWWRPSKLSRKRSRNLNHYEWGWCQFNKWMIPSQLLIFLLSFKVLFPTVCSKPHGHVQNLYLSQPGLW